MQKFILYQSPKILLKKVYISDSSAYTAYSSRTDSFICFNCLSEERLDIDSYDIKEQDSVNGPLARKAKTGREISCITFSFLSSGATMCALILRLGCNAIKSAILRIPE